VMANVDIVSLLLEHAADAEATCCSEKFTQARLNRWSQDASTTSIKKSPLEVAVDSDLGENRNAIMDCLQLAIFKEKQTRYDHEIEELTERMRNMSLSSTGPMAGTSGKRYNVVRKTCLKRSQ